MLKIASKGLGTFNLIVLACSSVTIVWYYADDSTLGIPVLRDVNQ